MGGHYFLPPQGVGLWGALTSKISAPPSGSGWGGTTFDGYLALNSLRNGRFEAENGATVWRAYGATAPSLLAPNSLVLTCSIFPRRVPPPIRFHISVLLISSRKWCSPTGGGALPPQGSRLWGGQLPPQLLRYGGAISSAPPHLWGGTGLYA